MAKRSLATSFFIILVVVAILCSASLVNGLGGIVGGWSKVKDVKMNNGVQDLGRYSVEEYNRGQRKTNNGGGDDLKFSEVAEAKKQVVSGIKYRLRIAATRPNGVPKVFDAVVVVKPWTHSRKLLNFAPSPATK